MAIALLKKIFAVSGTKIFEEEHEWTCKKRHKTLYS